MKVNSPRHITFLRYNLIFAYTAYRRQLIAAAAVGYTYAKWSFRVRESTRPPTKQTKQMPLYGVKERDILDRVTKPPLSGFHME